MTDQPLSLPDIPPLRDGRVRAAVVELSELVRRQHPEATFDVVEGEEPGTVWMWTTVDLVDTDPVVDLVIDRTMDLLVDDGIPIYVLPLRTPAREAEVVAANLAGQPTVASGD
jgi:hypothetical protein